MAGITQAQAETQLAESLAALSAARAAYSVAVGDRKVEHQRLEACLKDFEYWNGQVQRITRGGIRVVGITPSDG